MPLAGCRGRAPVEVKGRRPLHIPARVKGEAPLPRVEPYLKTLAFGRGRWYNYPKLTP